MTTKVQTISALFLAASVSGARAQQLQSTVANPPPVLSPFEQSIQEIKNPVPWLSWGGDLRVRNEYFDNILSLSPHRKQSPSASLHEQDYWRFRGRIWASITPVKDISLNVRLANESREWMKPAGYTPYSGHSGLDLRDGIFDTLNLQWRNVLQQPATLTVGRQDIFLGDGWLVGDGTPGDGSWTYFLDAARLTYDLKDQHTVIDVIGIAQDGHDNGWLQTINADQYLYETEQNEKGAILYVANSSLKAANLTGYFIYKHDDALGDIFYTPLEKKYRADNADIYTIGGRLSGALSDHWSYSAEGAYQFGDKQDPSIADNSTRLNPKSAYDFRDISAFGVNSRLVYAFKDRLKNQLTLSYEFLSGDDPNSHNDEMFDNLWGRWPRWSEIGLYSFAAENRIGNEANLHRLGPSWSFTPVKDLDFTTAYYALFAAEDVATRAGVFNNSFAGNANLPDHGNFRGHFVSAILKYRFNKHMTGHLWSEFELPGDYYASKALWTFLRAEVMFTF